MYVYIYTYTHIHIYIYTDIHVIVCMMYGLLFRLLTGSSRVRPVQGSTWFDMVEARGDSGSPVSETDRCLRVIYCRGLNNYQHYFGGSLIILIVSWAPKPYSNYEGHDVRFDLAVSSSCRVSRGYGFL